MAKMIQIRNVPEPVHRTLKARAARAGLTLSDFLRGEVEQLAELPTPEDLTQRIRARGPAMKGSSAAVIRRHRNAT